METERDKEDALLIDKVQKEMLDRMATLDIDISINGINELCKEIKINK